MLPVLEVDGPAGGLVGRQARGVLEPQLARSGLSSAVAWHNGRRQRLLRAHPSVRAMVGHNPWSAVIVIVMVLAHLAFAAWVAALPWYAVLLVAYLVGAVSAHAISSFIHEASHDLIFEGAALNRLTAIMANVPLVVPQAIVFRHHHLLHHRHLGEPDGADTQAPTPWELAFATSGLTRVLWYCVVPVLPQRLALRPAEVRWLALNWVIHAAVLVPLTVCFGWKALMFLTASGWFAFGPHPVAARRYGEHLTLGDAQPTTSYYGPYNAFSFNLGYHVEHHDLPSVPWNRLPTLKVIAPELYRGLASLPSWSALRWQLLTVPGEGPARYFLERPHAPRVAHAAVLQPRVSG
jgi:sphingolipid 4-desaturase/C4-monooxygenase